MKTKLFFCLVPFALLLSVKGFSATIYTYTWTGASSSAWNTSGNWSCSPSGGTYPGSSPTDIVVFNTLSAVYTVTLSANISVATIDCNNTTAPTGTSINTAGHTFTVTSTLALGNNSSVLTILGSGAVTFSAVTFQNGDILNCGSASDATTNVSITGQNLYLGSNSANGIFNYGKFTLTTSNIYAGATSQIYNESTGTFSCTGSNIYLYTGSSSLVNSGTFNLLTSAVYLDVNPCSVTNTPTGIFNMNGGSLISFNTDNNEEFYNYGTFNATTGANAITMISGASDNNIYNYGTFNAGSGTSSVCTITLAATRGSIKNTLATYAPTGVVYKNAAFNLGSASIIKFDASCSDCEVKNDAACTSCTFTLISDANSSATIYQIPSGSSCPGTFNVQRYLAGGSTKSGSRWVDRNYRLMSSPVSTVSSNSGSTNSYPISLKYLATSGIVTGAKGGYAYPNTFNSSTAYGNPTIYFFREDITPSNTTFTSGDFIGVTDITDQTNYTTGMSDGSTPKISVGNGFFFFFRGDNIHSIGTSPGKTTSPFVAPDATVFTAIGYLNQQGYQVQNWVSGGGSLKYEVTPTYNGVAQNNSAVRGFNLVGNPYPSSIDWETYVASNSSTTGIVVNTTSGVANVAPTIWVFNPFTNQFNTYMKGDGGVGKGSSGSNNGSTNANIIASGQAFFVEALNHASTLAFYETAKATSQPASGYLLLNAMPATASASPQYMRLVLEKDSINNDDMLIFFNPTASTKYSPYEDAEYKPGLGALESLASISSDSVKLAINRVPYPTQKAPLTIRLSVHATASGQYTFKRTDLQSVPSLYEIWLMDNYKKDSLDIRNNPNYVFDIDLADTNSFGNNRFQVVIRQNPALMVHLLNFTASKAPSGAQAVWKTENEQNYTNFTVERSTDGGVTFNALSSFASGALGTYSYLDKNPATGTDQYRLKMMDLDSTVSYSNIVTLIYGNSGNNAAGNISVYPNPANGVINLAINQSSSVPVSFSVSQPSAKAQSYAISIVNMSGELVKSATSSQSNWENNISNLSPGTYIIQVVNNNDKSVVGKTAFVKL